jgi:hypothetical protein
VPSAHLLYVRETLVRIAHLVGAAGEWEDDWDDDGFDDQEFVDLPWNVSDSFHSGSALGAEEDGPETPPSNQESFHAHKQKLSDYERTAEVV